MSHLHFFQNRETHDSAYTATNPQYKIPWTGTVKKTIEGAPYFVTYNRGLVISVTSLTFKYDGGSSGITVESDVPWSASSDSQWISLSLTSSTSGASVITVTVSENTGETRDGEVILRSSDGKYKTVSIKQKKESTEIPNIIWIDDFPDPQYIAEDMGYESFSDYMDDYIENPSNFGSNKFIFTHTTLEYDGETYFLYEYEDADEGVLVSYGLLPTDSDYDSLYEESMEVDYNNSYEPFSYILDYDMGQYFEKGQDWGYVVVKVETPVSGEVN